ncbi:MAG: hypothetical protein A2033_07645 [Bacteroidetes bacterium GWA2_31_9]|nr:MAG: hypothetical protein A2033_07645 [Bacteroidetes bacterium GWA2_31_9]
MKIVNIFANRLYAFQYSGNAENELKYLLNIWNDTSYLYKFLKANKNDIGKISIEGIIDQIIDDANEIDKTLHWLATNKNENLEKFFKQLNNLETGYKVLSLRKGRKNYLRIYALKIDDNCFIITGGAIKFTHLMEEREHTIKELQKLEQAKQYLTGKGVFDTDSFYELISEQNDK